MAGEPDDYDALASSLFPQPKGRPDTAAPSSAPGETDYDAVLRDLVGGRVGANLKAVQGTNPDQAARAQALSRASGLPLPAVEGAEDQVEGEVRRQAAESALREAPRMQMFFSQADFAKVAHDDAEQLGLLERTWAKISKTAAEEVEGAARGFQSGMITTDLRDVGRRLFWGQGTQADEARVQELQKLQELNKSDAFLAAAGEQIPIMGSIAGQGLKRGLQTGMAFGAGAAFLGQLGPQAALPEELVTVPAATVAGMAVGARAGALEAAWELETYLAFIEYRDLKTSDGRPMGVEVARGAALLAGTINAGLEAAGFSVLMKQIPGIAALAKLGGRKQVSAAIGTAVANNPTLAQTLGTFGARYAQGIGAESLTEMLQELSTASFAEVAKMYDGGDFKRAGLDETVERVLDAGVQAAKATAVLGLPGPAAQAVAERRRASKAQRDADAMREAGDVADVSALAKRDPERFGEVQGALLRDQGVDTIAIPAARLQEFMQDGAVDPTTLMRNLGVEGDQMAEALAVNGDVHMTPEAFAQHVLADKAARAGLIEHVRLGAENMTEAEAKEWETTGIRDEIADMASLLDSMESGRRVEVAQIETAVEQMMMAAGEARDTARYAATLTAQRYAVRAQRAGVSPLELWQQDALRIQRQGDIARRVDQVDLILDKARSPDTLNLPKTPVLDMLASTGVDPASPLAAELKAMGVTARSRPGLYKRGGRQAADNLVRSEMPWFGEEDDDGTGNYVSESAVLSAIRDELAGSPRRTADEQAALDGRENDIANLEADLERYNELTGSALSIAASPADEIKTALGELARLEASATFNQSAARLQAKPLRVDGTGPAGRVRLWDFAEALTARHAKKYGRALDPTDPKDYKIALKAMIEDYDNQRAESDTGEAWYTEDIAEAVRLTTEIIPELADPKNRDLFLTLAALLSPQQKPRDNWQNAIYAMQGYVATGKIALRKPNGKMFGVLSHTTGLQMMQHLIDTRGIEGALRFVTEPQTGLDMAQMRKDSGLFTEKPLLAGYLPSEVNTKDVLRGIYSMGPKVGDFMQNSVGLDSEAVTVDLWAARTYNRIIGRLTDVSEGARADGSIASELRGRAERDIIKSLIRDAAKDAGISASAMQAALWYFEQRLYRNHGIQSDSQNFSGAARAALARFKGSDGGAAGSVEAAGRDAGRGAGGIPEGAAGQEGAVLEQPAWHGSPFIFDRFTTEKIGSGEGAQAYGWGLYFASRKAVAQHYRNTLAKGPLSAVNQLIRNHGAGAQKKPVDSVYARTIVTLYGPELAAYADNERVTEAVRIALNGFDARTNTYSDAAMDAFRTLERELPAGPAGRLYAVELAPAEDEYLLWDKPLSEQSEKVKAALRDWGSAQDQQQTGGEFYQDQQTSYGGDPEEISRELRAAGIRGIKYLDGSSRNRPLREMKRAFLDALPEDAQFEDLVGLIGSGTFTAKQEELVRRLEADDWLGFDSPAQAISAALGGEIDQWTTSAELLAAVEALRDVGTYNYVIFDAADVSITGYEQRARGSIQFNTDATIIRLGANADRSTFLHESGHLYLEQLRADAARFGARNQQLVDDLNTVQDWWSGNAASLRSEAIDYARKAGDSASVAALEAMSDRDVVAFARSAAGATMVGNSPESHLSRAMHEQWARGVEDYFRTGQAPSVALQDAFNRFRAWLVSIYAAMRRRLGQEQLDIRFSPEVKAVMDRLLASDEEIALVEQQYNLRAMFGSAEEIGMSPGQFRAYQRAVAQASEDAKTEHLKQHMREVERERAAWWREERAKLRAEIAADVGSRPVYLAIHALAVGKMPNGQPIPAGLVQPRMDRAAVVAVLENEASLSRLPRVKGRSVYTTLKGESGSHPDVVASFYGYEGGREMLIEMMNAEPVGQAIDRETDARMREIHGDMQVDGTAVDKALEAAHTDKRGEVLAIELNALSESGPKMRSSFVRQWARERIAARRIEDLQPQRFLMAERRAAREAGKLLRAGDRLGAQRAKFQQLLNFHMAREAYKARAEVEKGVDYMAGFARTGAKFPALEAGYVDQIKTILDAYQLGAPLTDRTRVRLEMQAVLEWIERQRQDAGAIIEMPQRVLDADEKTNYRTLTLDEFRTLRDTIKNLEAQARLAKTTIIEGEERAISDMADEIVARVERQPQLARMARRGVEQNPGTLDRAFGKLASFDAALRKVELLLEQIDGERMGPLWRFIFKPFADAETARKDMTLQVTQRVMTALDNLPTRARLAERINVPLLGRTFARSDLIMMALNTGNESNYQKMIEGSEKDITEGARPFTVEGVDEALARLTAEEWALVQEIWDAFEGMWPQVREVYRRENGVAPERVEARTVETRWGQTLRGGYFPMMYDPARSVQARDIEGKTALEAMQSTVVRASVNSSMTKARTGFSAPVLLDITALPNHIERTAHFITHYEPVRATRKLLARRDVARAINNRVGPEYYDTLKAWVQELAANGQPVAPTSVGGRIVEAMRRNATVAIMGLSYTTMAAQVFGLANAVDALARQPGGGYSLRAGSAAVLGGLVRYLAAPAAVRRQVFAASGEMRHRLQNTDRDIRHALTQLSGKRGAWSQMQRFSLLGIAGVQLYMVDLPTWLAAYDQAIARGATTGEASAAADNILRTSQTAGGVKDLAAIQRERGVMTALTMFYSYFNLLYNLQRQALGNVRGVRDVSQLAARAFVLMAIPIAAEALVKRQGPDEDKDETLAGWAAAKAAIYALSSLPFLRDLAGLAEGFGYKPTPLDGFGAALGKSIKGIARAIDEGELDAKTLKALVAALGFGAGVPATQVNRVISAADKMFEGEDVGLYDFMAGPKREK